MKLSLVIPTLNASKYIAPLMKQLAAQTRPLDEIIVVDSSSDDDTVSLVNKYPSVKVISIAREAFNHGGARDMAFRQSSGDFILCLTQDAFPENTHYVENLLKPLEADLAIAMVSGRQVARPEASLPEKLTREFNYPASSFIRDKNDLSRLGIKTFFASDCCAAYRRSAYEAIGGFDKNILVNEDMKIAAKFIFAGYKIAYVGDAAVLHSHDYSLRQHFSRNFDVAAFISMNPDLFGGVSAEKEGIRMVKWVLKELLRKGHFFAAAHYVMECAAKYLGNRQGTRFRSIPLDKIIRLSGNKTFWRKWSAT